MSQAAQPVRTVVISGATGLVGSALAPLLLDRGFRVRGLSRRSGADAGDPDGFERVRWDGVRPPRDALRGAEAIVHLAGEPIFGGIPSPARLQRLRSSRIDSTTAIADVIGTLEPEERPRVLVCASAVGFYGDRGDEILDEASPPGRGFFADLCRDWEAAAEQSRSHGLRVVRLRIGVVLSRDGGALALMHRPFRLGLGGRIGSGRQWFPWIHIDDIAALFAAAVCDPRWDGSVNGVAPNPVRNRELTRELGDILRRPAILPIPAALLGIVLGPLADELLSSRRVVPRACERAGFAFRYPTVREALLAELGP